jgi:Holliday junction resolvasome RuvABC endonuclease subunit
LDLDEVPQPDDAADGVAVAICHLHNARLNAMLDTQGS